MQYTTQSVPGETDSMTCTKFTAFLLFLLFKQVLSEDPEPLFRAEGTTVEMGYCFGADYLLVYRSTLEGNQLLGNSSNKNISNVPPADLQGRTHINEDSQLLGLQVSNITHLDSGIYKRECWENQTRVSHHTQQLIVCSEEIEPKAIIEKTKGEGAEVVCNSTSIGLEGTSVRWYFEMHPNYNPTLFLDSNLQPQPSRDYPGVVQVRDGAARLILDNSVFRNNVHFYCLVVKGPKCISYQNIYPADNSQNREMFASEGERVVLSCPADGDKQQWETPHETLNASNKGNGEMYISVDDESEDFSLVIPVLSEEHSGQYSCISPSLEIQYSLGLCLEKISQQRVVPEKEAVSLQCNVDQGDSQQVQWHRRKSGRSELICDSEEKSHPIPEDLRGRLTVTEDGSLLTISTLHVEDGGLYWCIVLKSPEFLETVDDYKEDYNEDDDNDATFWPDTQLCTLKQETNLLIRKTGRMGGNPVTPGPGPSITTDPPHASNTAAYAVGAVLVGLLVLGTIVAIVVVKKRTRASTAQREAASYPATQMDTKQDPGCTDRLTNENTA